MSEAICRASPSLALLKYWGKQAGSENLPATPSVAVTVGGLFTETRVSLSPPGTEDVVVLHGVRQDGRRFRAFFDRLRGELKVDAGFQADSANSFPSAAGLASSSSGFAALACACARAAGLDPDPRRLSQIARIGSVSAARSLFGGFTFLPAGGRAARQLHDQQHWPQLRIVVALTSRAEKPVSSRQAMEATRTGSPYWQAWLDSSAALLPEILEALRGRDLPRLGRCMALSYSRMHAAMLAASPPILYWLPSTLAVIRACAALRAGGVEAWETSDAGPQVKVLCLEDDLQEVLSALGALPEPPELLVCCPGAAPRCHSGPRWPDQQEGL